MMAPPTVGLPTRFHDGPVPRTGAPLSRGELPQVPLILKKWSNLGVVIRGHWHRGLASVRDRPYVVALTH